LEEQTKHYNQLISEGGRPSHPLSLGQAILENPGEYGEILSYWQNERPGWKVFGPQLKNWQEFRQWQVSNRSDNRFRKYAEDVKRDLTGHGFRRQFNLQEDPELQDKLTTWIEYLGYEYWWYDGDVELVERRQPLYGKAREELENSGILRLLDTEEAIWSFEMAFERMKGEMRAEEAVITAERAVKLAQTPRFTSYKTRQRSLSAAQLKLDAAVKSLKMIQTANGIIRDFKTKVGRYWTAKKNIDRRRKLLKWILEQIPQIEREMKLEKEAANKENARTDKRCGLKRGRDDDLNVVLNSKHFRPYGGVPDHGTQSSCTPHGVRIVQHSTTEEPCAMTNTSSVESSLLASMSTPRKPKSPKKKSARSLSTSQSSKETKSAAQKLDAAEIRIREGKWINKDRKPADSCITSRPLRRSTRIRKPPEIYH
jgi:hypothetical protein